MTYNVKRSANKFTAMNTNKNKYVSLNEAIAAAYKAHSTLSASNRNRFKQANINPPFNKLNIQEYQRMVKIKQGIPTVSNLIKKRQNVSQPSFARTTNTTGISAMRAKTLANAHTNMLTRRANLNAKNKALKESRGLYSGGKLNKLIGKFTVEPYLQRHYNRTPSNTITVRNRMKRFT